MKKLGQIIFIIMFFGVIFAIPVFTKLQKNQDVSLFENRKLAAAPVLTRETLISGEYFAKWETYLADHIYKRNQFIKAYTYMNMVVLNKSKINNVVIGKEGYLLPFYSYKTKYDAAAHEKNIKTMAKDMADLQQHIQNNGGAFYFIGIPEQSSFHKDKYPVYFYNNGALAENAEKFMFSNLQSLDVPYINMNKVYRENIEKEYYAKTDHHYNFEGSYTAYLAIVERLLTDGRLREGVQDGTFEVVALPNPFIGSRNRQIYNLYPNHDQVQLAVLREEIPYEKFTNGRPDPEFYFYNTNSSVNVNYGVYMGGDWAETVIKTNRPELPSLLVFGDSFTNALEPLLYRHFNETRAIDLRHYKDMNLYDYIVKYKPDIVLMVRDDLSYASLKFNGDFKNERGK